MLTTFKCKNLQCLFKVAERTAWTLLIGVSHLNNVNF